MQLHPLPFDAALQQYQGQAEELLAGHKSGDARAIDIIHHKHPRFLDSKIVWLPKDLKDDEIKNAPFDITDAQLAVARWYCFQDWNALAEYVDAVRQADSPVHQFESAVEAMINGDLSKLQSLLNSHPELVCARSSRVTNFDPPMHRATLVHYLAANGVEGYRQKSPKNAVEIAKTLLEAGAEPDALADMYGGHYATLSMLASSTPPAEAGVQVGLIETLIDFGASVEARGSDQWASPLMTALVFGFCDAAEVLVKRGARLDKIAAAAGLGRADLVKQLLPASDAESRHRALALASQLGHVDIVSMLLDVGEDPNRFNPEGHHAHSTPLHQAALAGHFAVVRRLVEHGARLDIKDKVYKSTPAGWANHAGKTETENYLRAHQ